MLAFVTSGSSVPVCAPLLTLLCFAAVSADLFEVRTASGVTFRHENSQTPRKYLIEAMGGGVALLDYDNDGLLDIFFVNSGGPADRGFDRGNPRYWNRLYRQSKNGAFIDVTQAAGLSKAGEGNYGMGVAAADFDNDGYADLYVTSYGRNILYRNNGNGTFTDVTVRAGVAAGGWSTSAGFLDYDNDGKLDLFVARYMEWDPQHNKSCGTAPKVYCSPNEYPAVSSVLYRSRGDGTFEDVSGSSGIDALKGRALGVAFADYDDDGFSDIIVANDGMEQFLFHNNGNGTFAERAVEAGVALTDDGARISGMGVDFRDYDYDGRPDIAITGLARQNYALYRNEGNGTFTYRSLASGLAALSGGHSGWGMRFEDFDNDGWNDYFAAQGHVMDNVDQIDPSLHALEIPLLALARGGRFELAGSGMTTPVAGRGAAFGDLDNDGSIDVVMTVLGGRPVIFHNRKSDRHWLTITLRGTRSSRDGLGAKVRVNGQSQVATAGGSYLSSSDRRVHFGLGSATTADVEILWPSGTRQRLPGVRADRFLSVTEPEKP